MRLIERKNPEGYAGMLYNKISLPLPIYNGYIEFVQIELLFGFMLDGVQVAHLCLSNPHQRVPTQRTTVTSFPLFTIYWLAVFA